MFQKNRLTYGTVVVGLNFHQIFPPGFQFSAFFFFETPSYYFFIKENRHSAEPQDGPETTLHLRQPGNPIYPPVLQELSLDSHIHLCNSPPPSFPHAKHTNWYVVRKGVLDSNSFLTTSLNL